MLPQRWCITLRLRLQAKYKFRQPHILGRNNRKNSIKEHLICKTFSGVPSTFNYTHNEFGQTLVHIYFYFLNNLVHRDLKASKIILDSDINACLGDFRLVRTLEKEKATYAEVEGVPI
jgi:serine/threonine protein kinase